MEIKLHNIIVTVGPSMSGKSFWAEQLKTQLNINYPTLNVQIVSSDTIRRELIGEDLHRYDSRMMQVSNHAFDLLYKKVDLLSSWPINAEIIVVDTTGLSEQFRGDILKIAKKNNYNSTAALFYYKNNEDYFRFGGDTITRKHIKRLRDVHRTLNRFDDKIEIKSPDDPVDVTIADYTHYRSHFLEGDDYYVLGDLHGSWVALEHLKSNLSPNPEQLIYIGDIIDKAPVEDVQKTIAMVYNDVMAGAKFIIGNHEHWVVNYWDKQKGYDDQSIAERYFQSALNLDPVSKEKLTYLYNVGRYFYRTQNTIITHAPCEQKYLGKLHTTKQQKVYRYPRRSEYDSVSEYQEALYNSFDFLDKQQQYGYPTHIWGHVVLQKPYKNLCNIGIDTGAVYGNGLTYYHKYRFETIPSNKLSEGEVLNIKRPRAEVTVNDLDPRTRGRVLWMAKNKVNFISGTMAPSDRLGEELESLKWALDYYKDEKLIVVQPKYMGSRGQLYLTNNPETCYVITRNGYLFKDNERLYPEYQRLISRFQDDFDEGLQVRILDCEVLPWRLLGAGLIDKTFYGYGDVVKRQLENIQDLPIEVWQEYFNNLQIDEMSKEDVIKAYGHHVWVTYLAYKNLNVDLDVTNINRFLSQIDLYGQDGEPEIKPFTILKDVYENEEILYDGYSNNVLWQRVNDDTCLTINPNDHAEILKFWNNLTFEQGYEGVVIKPETQSSQLERMPYIKVRNTEYLRIVYSYDYLSTSKYNKLMRRKNIKRKSRKSIQDWQTGWLLLQFPYAELREDNQELIQSYINHVITESKESNMDPRL